MIKLLLSLFIFILTSCNPLGSNSDVDLPFNTNSTRTTASNNTAPTMTLNCDNRVFPLDGTNEPLVQGTAYIQTMISASSDADGDSLTFSCAMSSVGLSTSDPNYLSGVNCTNVNSLITTNSVIHKHKISFNSSTAALEWTPTSTQRGTFQLTISVSDGTATTSDSCYLTVRENYEATNLVFHQDALYSRGTTGATATPLAPRENAGGSDDLSTWLGLSSNAFTGDISNMDTAAPWAGNGTYANPYALNFDGTQANDNVVVADDNALSATAAGFGVESWSKPASAESFGGGWRIPLVTKGTIDGTGDYEWFLWSLSAASSTTTTWRFTTLTAAGATLSHAVGTTNAQFNEWEQVFGKLDTNGRAYIYVNGRYEAQNVNAALSSNTSEIMKIGFQYAGGNNWEYDGETALTRIYNSNPSGDQINNNYNRTANRFRETPIEDIYADNLILHVDPANYYKGHTRTAAGCADTNFYDMSVSALDGVLTNFDTCGTYGWQGTGAAGNPYVLRFEADDDVVFYSNSAPLEASTDISIEAWIKLDALPTNSVIFNWGNSANSNHFFSGVINSVTKQVSMSSRLTNTGNQWSVIAPEVFNFGSWYHIVWVKNSGGNAAANYNAKIYINGVEQVVVNGNATAALGHSPNSIAPHLDQFCIGGYCRTTNSNFVDGDIGPFRVYGVALTADQIKQNCLAQEARFTATPYDHDTATASICAAP